MELCRRFLRLVIYLALTWCITPTNMSSNLDYVVDASVGGSRGDSCGCNIRYPTSISMSTICFVCRIIDEICIFQRKRIFGRINTIHRKTYLFVVAKPTAGCCDSCRVLMLSDRSAAALVRVAVCSSASQELASQVGQSESRRPVALSERSSDDRKQVGVVRPRQQRSVAQMESVRN